MTFPSFSITPKDTLYDVIVVGAGAAGIGVSIALRDAGIQNFLVLERDRIGASFSSWPSETKFITPSFPSNSIGMLDLNSIAIGISPAFSLQVEHPTGLEYAQHLNSVANFFRLPILENTSVTNITRTGSDFRIKMMGETLRAKNIIWAAGEFHYPHLSGFPGSELCCHTATIPRYQDLNGDEFIVIGGYESGIDAAYHLASRGKRVRLFDKGCPWEAEGSDPSVALSTFTLERMREECFEEYVELFPKTPITSVTCIDDTYQATTQNGLHFQSTMSPLLATGFKGSSDLVANLFEQRDDDHLLLNEQDESTITPGIFLCGPAVRHDNHVFCFIFKYRQRFAVVAKAIATSLGLPADELERYRSWGMYLDDLSCCGEECVC